jgi:hypothetical protein
MAGRYVEPTYEKDIERLIHFYRKGAQQILHELLTMNLDSMSEKRRRALLKSIREILAEIDNEAGPLLKDVITRAYQDGQAGALVSLGEATTIAVAADMVSNAAINRHFVDVMINDTFEDLLAMTDNMERRVKRVVRNVVGEQLRAKAAANEGRRSMTGEVIQRLRKELEAAGSVGIVDRAGRRWKVEDYADMVVRTKIQQAHIEGVRNEAILRGALYGQISRHGATDACRYHEGRIVKLDPNAPGPYPTIESLRSTGQIWHPRCKHTVYPIRDLDLLPPRERERIERQHRIGEAAAATGKRNPNPDEVERSAAV